MFGSGMLLPRPVPLHPSADTMNSEGGVESGRTDDGNERERELKRGIGSVGSFLFKSRSFALIRSQTTHH